MKLRSIQIAFAILLAAALGGCHSSGSSSDDDDDDVAPPVTVTPSPTTAGEVIFTEIMANPDPPISDEQGEWFEVRNETAGDLNLRDCVFSDAATGNFTVGVDLIFGPGEYRTFSRGAVPGFTPDFSHDNSGLTLDDVSDTVTLTCNGVVIDAHTYPNPVPPSDSYALSNDGNGKWCYDSINNYAFPNSGTPGAANIVCP